MSHQPWRNWYHITIHAYGSWLRGDPRGWRARKHREHIDGDYRNPPLKGKFDRELEQSRASMSHGAVVMDADLREFVLRALVERLKEDGIQLIVASAGAKHFHTLAKFNDHRPRHWIGLAKKHASHLARQYGLRDDSGGLWAKRCGVKPIVDREHQVHTFHYVDEHRHEGAEVWRFDGRGTVKFELRGTERERKGERK